MNRFSSSPSFPQYHSPQVLNLPHPIMDPRNTALMLLPIVLGLLALQSLLINVEAASVFFLDSPTHQYLRLPSDPNTLTPMLVLQCQCCLALLPLLHFQRLIPPTYKYNHLNKVLKPNPFDRPHAFFALEVTGTKDSKLVGSRNNIFDGAIKSKVIVGDSKVDIQLSDEDEVSEISLNNIPSFDSEALSSDKELHEFAFFLGGSYASKDLPLTGELTIPLAGDANLQLDLSKKAEREFINSLVILLRRVERAMLILEDLSGSGQKLAELISGTFDGIKALQEQYGTEGVTEQGVELFAISIEKIFDYLQARYKGQMVGVIIHGEEPESESKKLLNTVVASRPSPRWLEETKVPANSTLVSEAVLVRRTIA